MRIVSGLLAGTLAGIAGAYAMERFQAWWTESERRLKPRENARAGGEPTTVRAAERVSEELLDRPLPDEAKPVAGEVMHYGMGAVSGAIYGAVAEVLPLARTGNGLAFGAALWWIADNQALMALGLAKPPASYPPSTHAYALASHLVYGFVTDTVRRVLRLVL
jgi:putative membrane protein